MLKFTTSRLILSIITICSVLWLAGCAHPTHDGPPSYYVDVSKIPNAKPRRLPRSRYGNPRSYVAEGKRYHVLRTARGYDQRGIASWYGTKFNGQLTSTRERYDMLAMTGASPVLPIPCFARVTNLENGRSIIVKINDRGPFAPNRILDLSYVAARKLGYIGRGTALVEVQTINVDDYTNPSQLTAVQTRRVMGHPELFLQLGAFREFAHAEDLKIRIEHMTRKPVAIHKGIFNHVAIYRVQIGPLVGVDESDYLQHLLEKRGLGEAITVINTPTQRKT